MQERAREKLNKVTSKEIDGYTFAPGNLDTLIAQTIAETLKAIEGVIKDRKKLFDGCELADHDRSYLAALQDLKEDINRLFTE